MTHTAVRPADGDMALIEAVAALCRVVALDYRGSAAAPLTRGHCRADGRTTT
jgi:hypothetical protein